MAIQEGTNYDLFDPEEHAKAVFSVPREVDGTISIPASAGAASFMLKCLARHYASLVPRPFRKGQKILDYGCGPSLPYSISAAATASEIVLAEYAKQNRDHIQKWLDRDPSAHDWSPYFKYVVETLEGGSEEEAIEREQAFRSKVRVVSCDISQEQFIEDDYMANASYDTVMSFLCLESGCRNLDSYKVGVKKLASLVKEGGYLLLGTTRREHSDDGYYIVNGIKFYNVGLKRDFIIEAIKQSRLSIINEDYIQLSTEEQIGNSEGFLFITACKN